MRLPKTIYTQAEWPSRKEGAEEVARRLQAWLAQLSLIDPRLGRWQLEMDGDPYQAPGPDLTSIVQANAVRSEDGDLIPISGFDFVGVTIVRDETFCVDIRGRVGAYPPAPWWGNDVWLTFDWKRQDVEMLNFGVFRAIARALIECWEPSTCTVRPQGLSPDFKRDDNFANAWMTYVWPDGVPHVDLACVPVVERMPTGGLLLCATKELFDKENSRHLQAAKAITEATRHLNDILRTT